MIEPIFCGKCSKPKGKEEGCCKCGRPLKFETVELLQEKIDEYFHLCDSKTKKIKVGSEIQEIPDPRPYTITGLALYLDTSRQTLIDYTSKEEFFDTIMRAKLKVENFTEESLWVPKIANGIMFNLKNNYGWKDKNETDFNIKEMPKPILDVLQNNSNPKDSEIKQEN